MLGIITARGGSKRIPHKNIKDFHGRPLLAWTADIAVAAMEEGIVDRFVLTTDDEAIARVGKECGLEVSFLRPAHLATDQSTSYEVVLHAIEWLKEHERYESDWVVLLEPSSPGRRLFHVREAAGIVRREKHFDSLIGVSEMPAHFNHLKELQIADDGLVSRVGDGARVRDLILRNQDVPQSYFINSSLYMFKTSNVYSEYKSLWGERTYGYRMDGKYAFDIDTLEDWLVAEVKMKKLLEEEA